MFATGKLTEKVEQLSTKTDQTALAVEEIRLGMLRPQDLENAVLKLKLEVMRGNLLANRDLEK